VGCKKTNIFFAFPFLPTVKTKDNLLFGIFNPLNPLSFSITTHIPIEWVEHIPPLPSPCD
jgi:hypothetical protein